MSSISTPRTTKAGEASKTQVKKEIRAHFAQHDGQVIYPSDIAEDLNLDYDSVLATINELEKEGKITSGDFDGKPHTAGST